MNKPKEELLNDSMMSLFFKMSVPAMVGMLAIGLYNLMDAIFVGRLVGESALGGIAVAFPFTMINTGIAVLIGIGSASVLSRAIGSDEQSIVDKILGNLIVSVFALSLVVTIAGYIYTEDLLRLVGASGDILLQGTLYLRIIFLGSFFVNFAQSANMLLRGEGRMKAAMLIMLVGTIINIILNPFLIVVFDMGIRGAAVATVISQVFMAVHTLLYFIKGQSAIKLNQLRLAPELMSGILAVGVSAMLMQVMNLLQQAVLFRTLSIYGGDEHIILMGAAMRVMMFAFIPIWGLTQGLQPVVGTNYGAKQYERVKKAVKLFAVAATTIMFIFWLPIQLFPKAMLGMFFQDGQIIELGYNLFRLMVVLFPTIGFSMVTLTLFQAIGKGDLASALVLLRQVILFIPLVIILPRFMGVTGAWVGLPATDLIIFLIAAFLLVVEFRKLSGLEKKESATKKLITQV